MAASTLRRVSGRTALLPLATRETVWGDTPASLATSCIEAVDVFPIAPLHQATVFSLSNCNTSYGGLTMPKVDKIGDGDIMVTQTFWRVYSASNIAYPIMKSFEGEGWHDLS